MPTTVTAYSVGQRLKAAVLNLGVTATQELQTANTAAIYESTKTSNTWTSSASLTDYGAWSTGGGYTSSGVGLTVPFAGYYLVNVYWATTSATTFTTRTFMDLLVNGAYTMRTDANSGVSEDRMGLMAITPNLAVGNLITPQRFQNSGGSYTGDVTLRIARLPQY